MSRRPRHRSSAAVKLPISTSTCTAPQPPPSAAHGQRHCPRSGSRAISFKIRNADDARRRPLFPGGKTTPRLVLFAPFQGRAEAAGKGLVLLRVSSWNPAATAPPRNHRRRESSAKRLRHGGASPGQTGAQRISVTDRFERGVVQQRMRERSCPLSLVLR